MHETNILRGLDWNLLRALDVLLTTRSVSVTARELGLSQPAVSHALARLREALGDPLLVRAGAAMVPTPRAEALATPLKRILQDLDRLLADAGAFDPATSRRRFVLACPDMLAPLVPEVLAALGEAPGVELELATAEAGADVVLGALPDTAPGMIARALGRVHQRVAVRRGHPALDGAWGREAWLAWPHVLVRTANPGPGYVERALAAAGLERRVGLYVPTFLLAAHVVAGSDLVFTAPGELLSRLPLGISLLPVPIPMPDVPVAAYWPDRLAADPGHRWFRERVVSVVGKALREEPLARS